MPVHILSQVTDSTEGDAAPKSPRGADKRARLVAAARRTLHEQGIERTTLAHVAAAADIPVGNVYYYFKTKDELLAAVIENYDGDYPMLREIMGRHRTPKARLKALVRTWSAAKERIAAHGCPIGSLCSELGKREEYDTLSRAAGDVLGQLVTIAQEQFALLGRRDARDLALTLVGAYEGAALLANSLRDPGVLAGEAKRLERWIDSIA